MDVIADLAALEAKIAECNNVLLDESDDAMRQLFHTFRMDFSAEAPADPFDPSYRDFQMAIYQTVAGKPYEIENERSNFDTAGKAACPFPYYLQSASTAGHHLLAIGFMLCKFDQPPGARILEFGPGWGNTTIELARLGYDVTAVDIDTNFCDVIRARAALTGVAIEVIESDFFWAETIAEPYDAVLFFECFHHCDDHLRLLRAMHRAIRPGGRVYLAAEPIIAGYGTPWGVRMDGEALWAARNFGWLELGFDETYFQEALARTGWHGTRHVCATVPWAGVWELQRLSEMAPVEAPVSEEAVPAEAAPVAPALVEAVLVEAVLVEAGPPPAPAVHEPEPEHPAVLELRSVYRSTSWRVTRPLRLVRRLLTLR